MLDDQGFVIVIDQLASTHSLRVVSHVGQRLPLFCSASGKAHLAQLGPDQRRALIASPSRKLTAQHEVRPARDTRGDRGWRAAGIFHRQRRIRRGRLRAVDRGARAERRQLCDRDPHARSPLCDQSRALHPTLARRSPLDGSTRAPDCSGLNSSPSAVRMAEAFRTSAFLPSGSPVPALLTARGPPS